MNEKDIINDAKLFISDQLSSPKTRLTNLIKNETTKEEVRLETNTHFLVLEVNELKQKIRHSELKIVANKMIAFENERFFMNIQRTKGASKESISTANIDKIDYDTVISGDEKLCSNTPPTEFKEKIKMLKKIRTFDLYCGLPKKHLLIFKKEDLANHASYYKSELLAETKKITYSPEEIKAYLSMPTRARAEEDLIKKRVIEDGQELYRIEFSYKYGFSFSNNLKLNILKLAEPSRL